MVVLGSRVAFHHSSHESQIRETMTTTLIVKSDSIISEIRKQNSKLADQIVSLGSDSGKVSNPAHTTPNLALFILALRNVVGAAGSYSNGRSQMALGTNRVATKENDKNVVVVLSETAEPILKANGKTSSANAVPSFYSAIANAEQVPGMKQGPEDSFLRYLSAFTTDFGGTVAVETLRKLRDQDAAIRKAYQTAQASK